MKKAARAFAPGNISLLFKVVPHKDPLIMTALGSGFTVDKGVTVEVAPSSVRAITYNEKTIALPTVSDALLQLTRQRLSVAIASPLPLGSGFGISGAAALAAVHAANALLSLGKTELELAHIAHVSEVIHKTGLGDVGNQQYGGCCVKLTAQPLFHMRRLPFTGTTIYAKSWGKIPTPTILSNKKLLSTIDVVGDEVLATLAKRVSDPLFSFAELLDISNTFTRKSGLIAYAPHANNIIQTIEKSGGHAAMIILGDAVVSDTPFEDATTLHISEQAVATV